jgi:hypothetical protein
LTFANLLKLLSDGQNSYLILSLQFASVEPSSTRTTSIDENLSMFAETNLSKKILIARSLLKTGTTIEIPPND